jgi:hypothetical protein
MTNHARPEDIADIASEWPDAYMECRTDRHDFKSLDAGYSPKEQVYERTRRCTRCHVEDYLMVSLRTGEVLKRTLNYKGTDGYLMPKGTGRLTSGARNTIRLEHFSRLAGVHPKPRLRAVAAESPRRRSTTSKRRRAS